MGNIILDSKIKQLLELNKKTETYTSTYTFSFIYYNQKTNELVSTNGRNLVIINIKPTGFIPKQLDIELKTGFYKFVGDFFVKAEIENNKKFVDYEMIIPEGDIICDENIFKGVLICMAKTNKILNIWNDIKGLKGIEKSLKILNKLNWSWKFISPSPESPVMAFMENKEYKIKFITMPMPM